jgi:hypothetical protein
VILLKACLKNYFNRRGTSGLATEIPALLEISFCRKMCASSSGKKFLRLVFAGNLTVIELFINRELIKSKL